MLGSLVARMVNCCGVKARGVLNKCLYGEASSLGPTPYPFIYHFSQKGTLSYTFY